MVCVTQTLDHQAIVCCINVLSWEQPISSPHSYKSNRKWNPQILSLEMHRVPFDDSKKSVFWLLKVISHFRCINCLLSNCLICKTNLFCKPYNWMVDLQHNGYLCLILPISDVFLFRSSTSSVCISTKRSWYFPAWE